MSFIKGLFDWVENRKERKEREENREENIVWLKIWEERKLGRAL